jgi:hypothetical protein
MLSVDPETTKVILVGTSKCPLDPSIPDLPGVDKNLESLFSLFVDKAIVGVPETNIQLLCNESKAGDINMELLRVAKAADNTLIVYYTGHGLIGEDSPTLLLAAGETTWEYRDANALPFEKVRAAIKRSPASRKILILDCCFSGRALDYMGQDANLFSSSLDIRGTFALASAPANAYALASGRDGHTVFTGELVHLLQQGIPNHKDTFTLEDIFQLVRARLPPDSPEPERKNWQDADKLAIAYNRGYSPPLPGENRFEKRRLPWYRGHQAVGTAVGTATLGVILLMVWLTNWTAGPSKGPAPEIKTAGSETAGEEETSISGKLLLHDGTPIDTKQVRIRITVFEAILAALSSETVKLGREIPVTTTVDSGQYRVTFPKGIFGLFGIPGNRLCIMRVDMDGQNVQTKRILALGKQTINIQLP